MAAPAAAPAPANTNCCDPLRTRFAAWETKYNEGIGKLAGKTFEVVNKLQTTDEDSAISRIGKLFAAFLMVATIIPLVGLFAAAGAASLWNKICGSVAAEPAAQADAPPQAGVQPPAAIDAQPQAQPLGGGQPPAAIDAQPQAQPLGGGQPPAAIDAQPQAQPLGGGQPPAAIDAQPQAQPLGGGQPPVGHGGGHVAQLAAQINAGNGALPAGGAQ